MYTILCLYDWPCNTNKNWNVAVHVNSIKFWLTVEKRERFWNCLHNPYFISTCCLQTENKNVVVDLVTLFVALSLHWNDKYHTIVCQTSIPINCCRTKVNIGTRSRPQVCKVIEELLGKSLIGKAHFIECILLSVYANNSYQTIDKVFQFSVIVKSLRRSCLYF